LNPEHTLLYARYFDWTELSEGAIPDGLRNHPVVEDIARFWGVDVDYVLRSYMSMEPTLDELRAAPIPDGALPLGAQARDSAIAAISVPGAARGGDTIRSLLIDAVRRGLIEEDCQLAGASALAALKCAMVSLHSNALYDVCGGARELMAIDVVLLKLIDNACDAERETYLRSVTTMLPEVPHRWAEIFEQHVQAELLDNFTPTEGWTFPVESYDVRRGDLESCQRLIQGVLLICRQRKGGELLEDLARYPQAVTTRPGSIGSLWMQSRYDDIVRRVVRYEFAAAFHAAAMRAIEEGSESGACEFVWRTRQEETRIPLLPNSGLAELKTAWWRAQPGEGSFQLLHR
jgi:hypothetical protein